MYQLERLKNFNGLSHGVSTKEDGNMSFRWGGREEVLKNRERFLNQLGLTLDNCVNMSLEHGVAVIRVDKKDKGKGMVKPDGITGDALITEEKDLFLFLLTADCLPVIFYDQKKEVLALGHASRQGTDEKIAQKVIEVFRRDYGSKPGDVFVAIGPAIHRESYKFSNPVQKEQPSWKKFLEDLPDGQTAIDVIGYTIKQLVEAGILEKNIEMSEIDTAASSEFFSHYRAVRTGEAEGRFATVVGLR